MHRWFFANERETCVVEEKQPVTEVSAPEGVTETEPPPIPTSLWPFCVTYDGNLQDNEHIAITGNCRVLGNWSPKELVILGLNKSERNVKNGIYKFEIELLIPRNIDIKYRYCIVAYNPLRNSTMLRFWEVHREPRVIRTCHNMLKKCDRFGYQDETPQEYHVDRGFLTTENYVHFKIFKAPFTFLRQRPRLLYVHIEPMYNKTSTECPMIPTDSVKHYSIQDASPEGNEQNLELAYTEVVNLRQQLPLHFQQPYGERCGSDDLVVYHCSIVNMEETLYRLDLYTFAQKAANDEPPYHYGYGFIQPEELIDSEGYVRLKINCASTHRPLIEMCVRYLIIRYMPNIRTDLSWTYERYWRHGHVALDIGHRGTGSTYRADEDVHRENTLYAFKRAAQHKADMVEFDVQLTKDAQVVVYHDHVLKFLLQRFPDFEQLMLEQDVLVFPHEELSRLKLIQMGGCKRPEHIAMPFESFTYEQLKLVRAFRFAGREGCEVSCDRMLHEQLPFPLLSDILKSEKDPLPNSLGFNIEIKWTQLDNSRRWEDDGFPPTFDRNFYVDTILELVLMLAGKRRIIFSSFDADICVMIRSKQNRYPVLLLTANPNKPLQYLDQRVNVMENAMSLACAFEFFGLALHTNSLLKDPTLLPMMQSLKLQAVTWGSINVCQELRKKLKRYGVIGIIYDRIDQLEQEGEQLKGIVCAIDNVENRATLGCIELAEWRAKCGYKSEHTSDIWKD